jgi:hypothetical protein
MDGLEGPLVGIIISQRRDERGFGRVKALVGKV